MVQRRGGGLAAGEWAVVGALFLAMAWAAAAQRHLWADGAFYFVQVGADRFFTNPVFAREHARVAGEWPEVALIWAGVRDGRALSVAYGLGHLLPIPAALLWFLLIVPREAHLPRFAAFAATGFAVSTSIIAAAEVLFLLAAAMPLVAVLYLRPREPLHLALAALLHLLAVRTYEVYPLLAVLVLHAAFLALRRPGAAAPVRALWALHLALAAFGTAVALWSLLGSRDSANTVFTVRTLLEAFRHPPIVFLTAACVAWGGAALLGPAALRRGVPWLLLAAAAFLVVQPWTSTRANYPYHAYLGRVTGAAVGLAVLGAACAAWVLGLVRADAPGAWAWARAAAGPVVLVVLLSWDAASTVGWSRFTDVYRAEIARLDGCGVVPVQETALWRDRFGSRAVWRYNWYWTSPYMVAALAPPGPVSVVFSNPPEAEHGLWLLSGPPPDLSAIGKRWALGPSEARPACWHGVP